MNHKIIWLTGHSRVGKSTLADKIESKSNFILLDGDEMRENISLGAGFSTEDRKQNNLRIARLAKVLSKQNNIVLTVIALIKEVREEITKICNPVWVYIKRYVPIRENDFYEESEKYDFVIDNNENLEIGAKKINEIFNQVVK